MLGILLSVLMLEVVTVGLSDSVKLHYCTRQLSTTGTQNLGIQSAAGIDIDLWVSDFVMIVLS